MSAAYPIVSPIQEGPNNSEFVTSAARVKASNAWRDLSTVVISPTTGSIPTKIVMSWMAMMPTINQKVKWLMSVWVEVGAAYEEMVRYILADPDLSKFKYILTIEQDNAPPQDGLQKLFESIEHYDAVGGLYWTKCDPSTPMIYGDPKVEPKNFFVQEPIPNALQECNGLGMGFTLFTLDMFRHVERPWFQTQNEVTKDGREVMTQDLFFFKKAAKAGYRFACDTRVRVGHYDMSKDSFS